METVNAIVALMTIVGGLLCARAFLPHVKLMGARPVDNLARGLLICAFSTFPRTAFWDLAWGALGIRAELPMNLMFNLVMLLGVYYILRARLLTIPLPDRNAHNIFTAVVYPDTLFPRLRKDE